MQHAHNGHGYSPEAAGQTPGISPRPALFPDACRLNIADPQTATRLKSKEPVGVHVDRYRGEKIKEEDNVFVFYEERTSGRTALRISPLNCARTPEELIEKQRDLEKVLAAGYVDPARMEFTILEVDADDAVELVARAFGTTHRSGVQLQQFVRSQLLVRRQSRGRLFSVVESYGLDFSRD
jgi:hypothetical protein